MTGAAEVVVPCPDLPGAQAFFVERLGMRTDSVFPADDPREVVVSGLGLRLRLRRAAAAPLAPVTLQLDAAGQDPAALAAAAPAGVRIELAPPAGTVAAPPLRAAVVVTRQRDGGWHPGRAGMEYRDLIPGRLGGHVVASHIRIARGGAVGDQVHHHAVRYQLVYCHRGAVRLVYEDQGAPFWLRAGEFVLQPPHIRHRVLECEPGLEVVELACPAEHATRADHDLELPTGRERPDREFGGQRFQRGAALAVALGDAELTARVRELPGTATVDLTGRDAARFRFVLDGAAELRGDDGLFTALEPGDAFTVPAGHRHAVAVAAPGVRLLEVALPRPS